MRLLQPLSVVIESGTFQSAKVGHYNRRLQRKEGDRQSHRVED
jgi:hypothetical protein